MSSITEEFQKGTTDQKLSDSGDHSKQENDLSHPKQQKLSGRIVLLYLYCVDGQTHNDLHGSVGARNISSSHVASWH